MYDNKHFCVGIAPVADYTSGNVATDVISMKKYKKVTFVVMCGAEAVGYSTITVLACTDSGGATTQAIPFRYKKDVDAGTTSDTFTAMAAVANTGFAQTAGAGGLYVIEVNSDDLYFVDGARYEYVKLVLTEDNSTAVTGAVLVICEEPRYGEAVMDSAIV